MSRRSLATRDSRGETWFGWWDQCDRSEAASSPRARTGSRSGCWSTSRGRAGNFRRRSDEYLTAKDFGYRGFVRTRSATRNALRWPGFRHSRSKCWQIFPMLRQGDELTRSDISLQQSPGPTDYAGERTSGACRTRLSGILPSKRLLLQAQAFFACWIANARIQYVVIKNLHYTRCAGSPARP
jgi:hypothetical protein